MSHCMYLHLFPRFLSLCLWLMAIWLQRFFFSFNGSTIRLLLLWWIVLYIMQFRIMMECCCDYRWIIIITNNRQLKTTTKILARQLGCFGDGRCIYCIHWMSTWLVTDASFSLCVSFHLPFVNSARFQSFHLIESDRRQSPCCIAWQFR